MHTRQYGGYGVMVNLFIVSAMTPSAVKWCLCGEF
jgi:hypothetical protein